MKRVCRIMLISMLPLLLASNSWADVVELKTGQRIEGTLKQASQDGVVIEVGGQNITFKPEQVRAIYFGTAPAPSAQTSVPQEALKALKALQSVTAAGVTYREYGPRVHDAKIQVDRYLQEIGGSEVGKAIAAAMGYYTLASSAWSHTFGKEIGPYLPPRGSEDLPFETCPVLLASLRGPAFRQPPPSDPAKLRQFRKDIPGVILIEASALKLSHVQELWSCASDKILEAEQILRALPGAQR